MIIIKKGDLLEATENIIAHQVNCDGVMGGGLALQIANKYPFVNAEYRGRCLEGKNNLYGTYQVCQIGEHKYIANCFTQRNFVTNLEDVELVFSGLLESCKLNNFTIAIPKKYGCGISKGNWEEVSALFERLSNKYGIDITIYELEEDKL